MEKVVLILLFFSLKAFSQSVDLKVSIQWLNQKSAKKNQISVVAKLGSVWEIPFENQDSLKLLMKVTPSNKNIPVAQYDSIISFLFEGQVIKKVHDKDEVIASPKIKSLLGQEAIMTIQDTSGKVLELIIIPNKVTK